MRILVKYFLQGILILLPIALTIYIVVAVFRLTDSILGRYFIALGINIPGLGLLTTLVIITLVGLLGSWFVSRRLLEYVDYLFGNVPLVRLVYNIIKDTIHSLVGNRSSFARVVMFSLPGDEEVKLLGFVTAEEDDLFGLKDYVAVYILQSMQWAGFTLLVPKKNVQFLDVSADRALQFIISAGITGKNANADGKRG